MRRNILLGAVFTAAILLGLATAVLVQPPLLGPMRGGMGMRRPSGDLEIYYTAKAVLSTVNSFLLLSLLIIYMDIYRKTGSQFTIGLVIFSTALLLYAFTSNPLLTRSLGYMGFGLGPFAMLPDLFTCVASAVLLYLVQQ